MDTSETTRLRALLERAALPACEAYRDEDIGTWHVRRVEGGDCVARVEWCGHEPLAQRGATEARAQLFAAIPTALPGLLDAAERAERAEHMHATVLASLTHALAQGDALNAEAKDMHDRMTAAEVRATGAERERDDLAATLETRNAEHALAMARVAELEARLTAARKATEDLPRHLGASWWGQQLRAALVEPTAEVSR